MPNNQFLKNKERLKQRANNLKDTVPVLQNYLETANYHLKEANKVWTYGGFFPNKRNTHIKRAQSAVSTGLSLANRRSQNKSK